MKRQEGSIRAPSLPVAAGKIVWPTLMNPSRSAEHDRSRTLAGSGTAETNRTLEWVVWTLVILSLLLAVLGGTALVYGFLQIGVPMSR